MNISAKDWDAYVKTLRLLSDTAANKLQAYINKYGIDDATAIAEYAHALITKYGEGSAELACQMYDAIGQAEGVILPSAVPAPIPTRDEVERAVLGSFAQSPTGKVTASIADRYVKLAAEDTMARNAIRDRAEWAWVPHGDTCAFCITLASRGWQIASKRILRGGHAEHVHAHCDCQFAIRHDGKSNVSGYDPDKYYQMYKNAEGNSPKDKINSLRRELEDREEINSRRRADYAKMHPRKTIEDVSQEYLNKATPGRGLLAFENGTTKVDLADRTTATWIHDKFGGDIKCLKEISEQGKNPDSIWNGKYWEFKAPTTENAIDDRLRKANKQIMEALIRDGLVGDRAGVLIDISGCELTVDESIRVIEKRALQRLPSNIDVIVKYNDEFIKAVRVKT